MGTAQDPFREALAAELAAAGIAGTLGTQRPIGGSCIHDAWRIEAGDRVLFVKRNRADCADMFAAEAAGLEALAAPGALRVPLPIAHGTAAGEAYLVTEFVAMGGNREDPAGFGRALARLHASTAPACGWYRDNYIGTTPQPNAWYDDWVEFWRERRLRHQLTLARWRGAARLADRGERLCERLEAFFPRGRPPASLLHGDLWAGNYGYDTEGSAVLFDPAVYYGDREADLAMTELFGGFPEAFRRGYEEEWPLDAGYPARRDLYNLYHVLNHAHLFGGGYARRAEHMIEALLAQAG